MVASLPKGKVPEGSVVKASTDSTSVEENEEVSKEAVAKEPEVDLDESDLEALDESRKIPYSRFKEVNEKAKSYETKLRELEQSKDAELRRIQEDAEIRARARLEREQADADIYSDLDPQERNVTELQRAIDSLKEEVSSLRSTQSQSSLMSEVTRLQADYPEADRLAVLGWQKSNPNASLDELMALSHEKNVSRAENMLKALIQKKKDRAKAPIPTGINRLRLDDSEKPKTMRDASKGFKDYLKKMTS